MNMLFDDEEQRVELVSHLLKAEKLVVSKLRRDELNHRAAANLMTRINTGIVTLVQGALDDEKLAKEIVRSFDEAIEKGYTAVPAIVSTLAKVVAMRHDIEFNGHRPGEKELKANLAALKMALDLDDIDEQLKKLEEQGVERANQPKDKRSGNQMFG